MTGECRIPRSAQRLAVSGAHHTSEIVAVFAHRADAPSQLWSGMLERVRTNLDLLGYAMLFLPEQHPELARLLDERCARGLRVRITLADPMISLVGAWSMVYAAP